MSSQCFIFIYRSTAFLIAFCRLSPNMIPAILIFRHRLDRLPPVAVRRPRIHPAGPGIKREGLDTPSIHLSDMPIRLLVRVSVLYSAKGTFNGSRLIWYFRRGCCLTRAASLRILLPQEASIIPAAGSRRFRTPLSCTMHLVGGYPPPSAALLQQKRSQKETIIPDLSFVRISRTDEKRATGLQKEWLPFTFTIHPAMSEIRSFGDLLYNACEPGKLHFATRTGDQSYTAC